MALTFPAAMPVGGVARQYFEPERVDYLSPVNRGRLGGVQAGFPLWRMRVILANTVQSETDDWRAFVTSLRGAQRTFLACDLSRPLPREYPNGFSGMTRAGGGSFNGDAGGWSVNGSRDVVTLTNLPASFKVSKNDYLGFRWDTSKWALVRSVEDQTANGSGAVSFTVEPPVPGGDDFTMVPDDALATLANPKCIMRLDGSGTDLGEQDHMHSLGGAVAAIQDLIP